MTTSTPYNFKHGFILPNGLDWNAYIKYRPAYPPSFYSLIYAHHALHSNRWDVAHDVGSGAGLVAEALSHRFNTVAVSDPNELYLSTAQQRLSHLSGNFVFKQAKAEEMCWLGERSADLITIGEALHWTDWRVTVREAARALRPGGTFAAWYYGPPRFLRNEAADTAWTALRDEFVRRCYATLGEASLHALHFVEGGMDSLPFPEELYEPGAKRVKVNFAGEEYATSWASAALRRPLEPEVGERDIVECVEVPELRTVVDVQWLQSHFRETGMPPVEARELWRVLEEALEGEGGKGEVEWPFALVLATAK